MSVCDDENAMPLVLVVDDTPDNLDVIRAIIERKGYQTEGASTAGEALDALEARCSQDAPCFDLAVVDIDLPDAKGGTLAAWIQAMYPGIPIVLLTAYGKLPVFDAIAKALGIPLETKPINISRLYAVIDNELCGFQTRREIHGKSAHIPPVMAEQIERVRRARAAQAGEGVRTVQGAGGASPTSAGAM